MNEKEFNKIANEILELIDKEHNEKGIDKIFIPELKAIENKIMKLSVKLTKNKSAKHLFICNRLLIDIITLAINNHANIRLKNAMIKRTIMRY